MLVAWLFMQILLLPRHPRWWKISEAFLDVLGVLMLIGAPLALAGVGADRFFDTDAILWSWFLRWFFYGLILGFGVMAVLRIPNLKSELDHGKS